MLKGFPYSFKEAVDWSWEKFAPFAQELLECEITTVNLNEWLSDESQFLELVYELNGRLAVAVDQNSADQSAKDRLYRFRDQVWSKTQHLMNQLEQKLIESNFTPPDYDIQLKRIQTNLEIFHPDNVDLEVEAKSYRAQYEAIQGKLKIEVYGENHSVFNVLRFLHIEPDRMKREFIYKKILSARTAVKEDYDTIWRKLFALRKQIARNAGLPDYRAYMWKKLNRQDYIPQDVITFCEAIEAVVVPVVAEIRKQQAAALGLNILKPWDKTVEMQSYQPLKPYHNTEEWLRKSRIVFNKISPRFADHFDTMQSEGLLDLESRPNKSPWNYAERLPASDRTFIFINGRGGNGDLFMLFHEFGHAVHMIEMSELPFMRQKMLPEEIGEVASTTMELLASEYLTIFYSPEQAQIVRHNHLTSMLLRWPFVAMAALFQHWVYTHPDAGADPASCDEQWLGLCNRFMPGIDNAGFEDDLRMQWREFLQVFVFPFYSIEYAFAQFGAVQIWQNYQTDPQRTISQFRHALSRGHTISIPEFYSIAGAKFRFDTETLKGGLEAIQRVLVK